MALVLVVDDERENREALCRAIGDENPDWQLRTARDEAEALALLGSHHCQGTPIDVILTDLVMDTERSGMTILVEARKLDPFIMAILFTAKETCLDRFAALEFGAFDVVEKNIRGTTAVREIIVKTRAALRYRSWIRRITFLRRYFDPRIFETVEKDPSLLTLRQRTVTICFWDIRGFSRLCDILKAHPTLIAGFLREYSEAAARAVFEHGGLLDKFIGDGVMALFGVLQSNEDGGRADAIAAVTTALSLRGQFAVIAARWMEQWKLYTPAKIELGVGAGIHTGEVLVGNIGTDFRDQFTALGPHVNFASRIQGRAVGGQVLLSQSTEARVRSAIRMSAAGEISDIKNIEGTFVLYSAESLRE